MTELPAHQLDLLRVIGSAEGITAAAAGVLIWPNLKPRSRSTAAAQNSWELVRRGLVERRLLKRELYEYHVTAAGRIALAEDRP